MYESTPDIKDYWQLLLRRKWAFTLPCVLIITLAVMLAMLLPAVFRSEATILIQRQTIPQEIVATTVTGYAQERIQQILQRIITHNNIVEIAEKFYLYPDEFGQQTSEAVVKVRDNIDVQMLDVQASDPDKTGTRVATIAFTVSYAADDAEVARQVTDDLADRFLEEHKNAREELAAQVSSFLGAEAEALETEIASLEQKLAGFKQDELHQLPEMMSMNLQLFERTEQQIVRSEEKIRGLQDKISALRAELSLTDPYEEVVDQSGERILNAEQRLSVLTATYLQNSSRYSARHPDIVRVRREIRILAEQTGNALRADELLTELVSLEEQVRQARQNYSDEHPEVVRLESAIAAVKRGFQSSFISTGENEDAGLDTPPNNPRYVALKTEMDATENNLVAEQQSLQSLEKKLVEYEDRLFQTPSVESEYKAISRGYDDALRKYSELKQKQLQAEISESLEAGDGAEQWVLLSKAFLPSLPESPNRIGIVLLGTMLAFGAGIATVALFEYNDKTLRSAAALAKLMGVPPLAVIPRIHPMNIRKQT